jgi:hypothetical protein
VRPACLQGTFLPATFAGCTVTSTSLLCWTSCCVSGAPRLTLVRHLLLCYYLFVRAVPLLRVPFRFRSSMACRRHGSIVVLY